MTNPLFAELEDVNVVYSDPSTYNLNLAQLVKSVLISKLNVPVVEKFTVFVKWVVAYVVGSGFVIECVHSDLFELSNNHGVFDTDQFFVV